MRQSIQEVFSRNVLVGYENLGDVGGMWFMGYQVESFGGREGFMSQDLSFGFLFFGIQFLISGYYRYRVWVGFLKLTCFFSLIKIFRFFKVQFE